MRPVSIITEERNTKKIRRLLFTSNRLCYPNNLITKKTKTYKLLVTIEKSFIFFYFYILPRILYLL